MSQLGLAKYAICPVAVFTILGEAAFTRSQLPEGAKGRPSIIPTVGAALGFAAVCHLFPQPLPLQLGVLTHQLPCTNAALAAPMHVLAAPCFAVMSPD